MMLMYFGKLNVCTCIRGNMISRKFANCSINVILVVFKTYCSCLYTSQLWGTCLSRTMNRLKVAYNDSLRMVLGIPRYYNASEMFAYIQRANVSYTSKYIQLHETTPMYEQ